MSVIKIICSSKNYSPQNNFARKQRLDFNICKKIHYEKYIRQKIKTMIFNCNPKGNEPLTHECFVLWDDLEYLMDKIDVINDFIDKDI